MSERKHGVIHCWEDGPTEEDGCGTTCMLDHGHEGQHQWMRDDKIIVSFPAKSEDRLRAEVEAMRKALKPFAEAAPFFEQRYCKGDLVIDLSRQGEHAQLTVGDLRRAKAALDSFPPPAREVTEDGIARAVCDVRRTEAPCQQIPSEERLCWRCRAIAAGVLALLNRAGK